MTSCCAARRTADHAAVEQLQRVAFDDPHDLPSLVAALRRSTGPLPPVSIVATDGDLVVGHVMLSAGRLDAPTAAGRRLRPLAPRGAAQPTRGEESARD